MGSIAHVYRRDSLRSGTAEMPSPLAHGAVALALWPVLRRSMPNASLTQRASVAGMLLLGTLGADLDIPLGFVATGEAFEMHGGATHSLFAGAVFGVIFALVCRRLANMRWMSLAVIGASAWWSHVLLDAFTPGRGVAIFWPLVTDRFNAPVAMFYGVRHSDPLAWQHHLLTITTEMPFVIAMCLLGMFISRRLQSRAMNQGTNDEEMCGQ